MEDLVCRHLRLRLNHAAGKSEEEIRCELGADGLLYQSIEDLIAVGADLNPSIREFDTSCFTGAPHIKHTSLHERDSAQHHASQDAVEMVGLCSGPVEPDSTCLPQSKL